MLHLNQLFDLFQSDDQNINLYNRVLIFQKEMIILPTNVWPLEVEEMKREKQSKYQNLVLSSFKETIFTKIHCEIHCWNLETLSPSHFPFMSH